MSRATFVLRDGELVDKRFAPPLHAGDDAPMVIRDSMDPIQSMADGQFYDSKRAYARGVRRAGCEIVGNDKDGYGPRPDGTPTGVGQSIKTAIEQLRGRV